MSENFIRRVTEPSYTDLHWIHVSKGGYNKCILIKDDSVLPNCVGYAWGRFLEECNITDCKLSRGNAEDWYGNYSDGYERGQDPKLGSVVCWRKGKVGYGGDGAGHVAIVEDILSNGDIVVSNSAYNGRRWFEKKVTKASGYKYANGYTFQGFIYTPIEFKKQGVINVEARILTKGMRGDDVRMAMLTLKDRGYYSGTISSTDKLFGNNMETAVKKFQKAKGLSACDGIIGEETWNKLLAE